MTAEKQYVNVVCPTEDELVSHKIAEGKQCPVIECGKSIKNSSAMRMHLAQTHGIGAENVLQTFNKAFIVANQTTKSLFACPVFTCSRTYGSGRYFKALSTLREHYLSMHAEKKHICDKCGAKFGNPRRLKLHSAGCKTIFYCTCGCPFKKREALLEHTVRSQHELPEDIKLDILKKNKLNTLKDKEKEGLNHQSKLGSLEQPPAGAENPQGLGNQALNGKSLIVVPQNFSTNNMMKSNAYFIVSCQNVGTTSANTVASMLSQSVPMPFKIVQSKSFPAVNVTTFSSAPNRLDVNFKSADSGKYNNTGDSAESLDGTMPVMKATFGDTLPAEIVPLSSAHLSSGLNGMPINRTPKYSDASSSFPIRPSLAAPRNDLLEERNKRVDEAMKQYVPIKRKSPLDPVVSDWHCSVPRRKYKRRKRSAQGRMSSASAATGTGNNDESSVSSMQDCLQKASTFVKNMLPKMRSPKRGASPDHLEPARRQSPGTRSKSPSNYETSSQGAPDRYDRPAVANSSVGFGQEGFALHHSLAECRQVNSEASHSKVTSFEQRMDEETALTSSGTASETNTEQGFLTSDTQTNENEFNLDNLSPDLLFDIETQTEDFSNFFSDAFTQTIQKPVEFGVSANQTASAVQSDFTNTAACWVNNNQTQTDEISQLIVDAFTQTRVGMEENDSFPMKAGQSSMSDNHTQTILSSDNFFKNLNFGTEDEALDSAMMPDLIDICTQTAPDPSFDELLAFCSAEVQTANASTCM